MNEPLTGKLLIASPSLVDPNFNRTVVLMLNHSAEGALGVVLNRPLEERLEEIVPQWLPYVAPPAALFGGGPVDPAVAIGLAPLPRSGAGPGWTEVVPGLGLVDLGLGPEAMESVPRELRVFSGYAGWGEGQLDGEIGEGAWFVVETEPGDVFTADPETLWRRILRRQRGKLAMFAYFPEDPSHN